MFNKHNVDDFYQDDNFGGYFDDVVNGMCFYDEIGHYCSFDFNEKY